MQIILHFAQGFMISTFIIFASFSKKCSTPNHRFRAMAHFVMIQNLLFRKSLVAIGTLQIRFLLVSIHVLFLVGHLIKADATATHWTNKWALSSVDAEMVE